MSYALVPPSSRLAEVSPRPTQKRAGPHGDPIPLLAGRLGGGTLGFSCLGAVELTAEGDDTLAGLYRPWSSPDGTLYAAEVRLRAPSLGPTDLVDVARALVEALGTQGNPIAAQAVVARTDPDATRVVAVVFAPLSTWSLAPWDDVADTLLVPWGDRLRKGHLASEVLAARLLTLTGADARRFSPDGGVGPLTVWQDGAARLTKAGASPSPYHLLQGDLMLPDGLRPYPPSLGVTTRAWLVPAVALTSLAVLVAAVRSLR